MQTGAGEKRLMEYQRGLPSHIFNLDPEVSTEVWQAEGLYGGYWRALSGLADCCGKLLY